MKASTKTLTALIAFVIGAGLSPVHSAPAQEIDLSQIKPVVCPAFYSFNETKKACEADASKVAAISAEVDCADAIGLKWNANGDPKCTADPTRAPKPTCGALLPDLVNKDGQCVVRREVPRSSLGNYLGDCFVVSAPPATNELGLSVADRLVVMNQRDEGQDKLLTVSKGKRGIFGFGVPYFCEPQGRQFTVRASELEAVGAERMGWTYGVLTMPFKYYRHDKSFTSNLQVGPYIGRRSGTPGSAVTFAMAATIGTVKGEVRNEAGNVTGTPDLTAFSLAAGWMLDLSKAPGLKPFKAGLFFGQDRVSKSDAVSFKHNGRGWIAFQLGFDFTD